jgi:hypothetical protein
MNKLDQGIETALNDLCFNYKPVETKDDSSRQLRKAIKEVGRRISALTRFNPQSARIDIERTDRGTYKVSYYVERHK